MSYILDALRKAEIERRGVSLGDHLPRQSRVPFRSLVTILVLLNVVLIAWLLIDPTKPRLATDEPVEKSTDHVIASKAAVQTESSKSPPGLFPTPQLSPPDVSAVQEVDLPRTRPELVYYRDFEGVVGNAFPNLGITIHTYTAEPRERAIHIGGNMWREGDEVSDGMILETITENGIEVTYQGYRVLIDVFEMWDADN